MELKNEERERERERVMSFQMTNACLRHIVHRTRSLLHVNFFFHPSGYRKHDSIKTTFLSLPLSHQYMDDLDPAPLL